MGIDTELELQEYRKDARMLLFETVNKVEKVEKSENERLTDLFLKWEDDLKALGIEEIQKEMMEYIRETCKERGMCEECFAEIVEGLSSIDGDITVSCECSTRTIHYGGVGK